MNETDTEEPLPQLEMRRTGFDNLPAVIVPDGYRLRTYRPGDEKSWCEIMEGNIGSGWTVERCETSLIQDDRFAPENLFFATTPDDVPVASACAWPAKEGVGQVHMVAALEAHRGAGSGHLVNAAVLVRLRELGFRCAHLLTDDHRLAAIRSYLTAGFQPHHTHRSHPDRWTAVLRAIENLRRG